MAPITQAFVPDATRVAQPGAHPSHIFTSHHAPHEGNMQTHHLPHLPLSFYVFSALTEPRHTPALPPDAVGTYSNIIRLGGDADCIVRTLTNALYVGPQTSTAHLAPLLTDTVQAHLIHELPHSPADMPERGHLLHIHHTQLFLISSQCSGAASSWALLTPPHHSAHDILANHTTALTLLDYFLPWSNHSGTRFI